MCGGGLSPSGTMRLVGNRLIEVAPRAPGESTQATPAEIAAATAAETSAPNSASTSSQQAAARIEELTTPLLSPHHPPSDQVRKEDVAISSPDKTKTSASPDFLTRTPAPSRGEVRSSTIATSISPPMTDAQPEEVPRKDSSPLDVDAGKQERSKPMTASPTESMTSRSQSEQLELLQ